MYMVSRYRMPFVDVHESGPVTHYIDAAAAHVANLVVNYPAVFGVVVEGNAVCAHMMYQAINHRYVGDALHVQARVDAFGVPYQAAVDL
jgi:hypothetical protein